MSNCMEVHLPLFLIFLNQLITASGSYHWFTDNNSLTFVFIFSINNLPALPISFFVGFINLHFGLDLKFSLRSFRLINAFVLAKQSSSSAIALASLLILLYALLFVFRYVLEIFSVNSLLQLLMSVLYRFYTSFVEKNVNVLGFFDRHHILSQSILELTSHLSESYTFDLFEQIIFKSNKVVMMWWTFSTFKNVIQRLQLSLPTTLKHMFFPSHSFYLQSHFLN